jgi:phage terminase small subunit
MPALINPKYERFAQLISEGKSGTEAYIAAGHEVSRKTAGVNASRLLKDNPEIKARVEELLARRADIEIAASEKAIEALAMTKEHLTEMLKADRELARTEGKPEAAVAAVMAMAKLHGLLVDKKHVTGDHKHHHTTEPLSDSAQWLEKLLGDGTGRAAKEPRPN